MLSSVGEGDFPVDNMSVRASVCLVHCGKTADRIRMPYGIVGPGMRQVMKWGLGIGPREGVLLGANLGRAIVTDWDFTAYTCATVPRRGPLPKLLWANLSILNFQITVRSATSDFNLNRTLYDFVISPVLTTAEKEPDEVKQVVVCTERCQPGHWSSSGLEPCHSCTPGSYQSVSAATQCIACPPHRPHTLPYSAAVSALDCFGQ